MGGRSVHGSTRLVAGRYRVLGELGRGGMGVVWRAHDQVIDREVALKELAVPSGGSERVLREARTAGRLNDPGVVTVYDVLVDQGVTYVVMELVRAPTLAEVMAAEGALSADRVAAIGLRLLAALQTAHNAGIVHRDVKPSNVMVLGDGRVKLADFGIARALDDPNQTASGAIMGSPGYMAPELFRGAGPSPAADLWALGATLFHAVEGRAPFQRDTTAATMHAIMYEEPRLERCSGPMASVVMGLLTQSPEQRLTATQVRQLLSAAGEQTVQVLALPGGTTRPSAPWQFEDEPAPARPPRRLLLVGGAAALVVGVAVAAVFLFQPSPQQGIASAGEVVSTTSASSASPVTPTSSSAVTTTTSTVRSSAVVAPPSTTPTHTRAVLTRYRSQASGWHFSGTSRVPTPAGFSAEGPLGALLATAEPGTRAVYSCKVGAGERFTSVDQTGKCEGQQVVGLLGYAFAQPPADTHSVPLYRCNQGGNHFDSLSADCEGPKNVKEGVLGYLLP